MESDKDRMPRRGLLREAVGGALLGAMFGGGVWIYLCWRYMRYVSLGDTTSGDQWVASRWVALGLVAAGAVIGLIAGIRMELRRMR